ncbi:MAG: hypothetical protein NZ769_01775 [Anaerolineae bacterium]|nr:hypothetical protein [Anaerolineae bacterium]MCX8068125.1 hypothetical protein [Anaerolineae bacterium]
MLNALAASLVQAFFLERDRFKFLVRNKTSEELAEILENVLNLYANDKNSSMLREWVVLYIAGCNQRSEKIGYNGYRGDIPYEVKPRNVCSDEPKHKRLNGDGNFTDFTYERLEKYLQDRLRVLVAGFVDGNLLYILEVPIESLQNRLRQQLERKFKEGRPSGVFLRSARFSFRDYQNDSRVQCLFLHPRWRDYYEHLTRPFRKYLESIEGTQRCPSQPNS